MRPRISALAACAALIGASAAPLPPPPRGGGWTVDWGDYHCSLIRQAEGGELIVLRRAPGARTMELRWVNLAWTARSRPRAAELFLEPGHVRGENFVPVPLEGDQGVGSTGIDYHFLDRLKAAATIRLESRGKLVQEIGVPGAAKAVQAMRQCDDTALREAGVDPVAQAALRELPKPFGSIGGWISNDDYPSSALRDQVGGTVVARMEVGPDGAVRGCTVVVSSAHKDLDETTCRIFRERGRFQPAIGADGAPSSAFVIQRIVWTIQ